jgi:hypothetical protein
MMASYRMSYHFPQPGPPKPKAELGPNEGLTDTLVLISILGTPGGPGPLSIQWFPLGPDGLEPVTPALAINVAMAVLTSATGGKGTAHRRVVDDTMAFLRRIMLAHRVTP